VPVSRWLSNRVSVCCIMESSWTRGSARHAARAATNRPGNAKSRHRCSPT
jgi:hypothetical protein